MAVPSAQAVASRTVEILARLDFASLSYFDPDGAAKMRRIAEQGVFSSRAYIHPDPLSAPFAVWDAMEAAELAAQKINLWADHDDEGAITADDVRAVHHALSVHRDSIWSAILHDTNAAPLIPPTARNAHAAHRKMHAAASSA